MQNDRGDVIYSPSQAAQIAIALMPTQEQPTPETPEAVIERLEKERSLLRSKLNDINTAVLNGDVQAVRNGDLPSLTLDLAACEGELNRARKAQAEAEAQAREATRLEREGRFPQVVEEARRAREEARRAFRDLATALGKYCTATRQAIVLNGELRAAFPDSDRWNDIRDLENRAALIPLHDLQDAGYSPLMDFGHDLSITVPPLLEPGKKEGN